MKILIDNIYRIMYNQITFKDPFKIRGITLTITQTVKL